MSRPDLDAVLAGDLAPDELDALRARAADDAELAATLRLVDALASSDRDVWLVADTPALRYVPDGAGRTLPIWSRLCIRSDARAHSVGAPFITVAVVAVLLVGLVGGFVLGGATDDERTPGGAVADAGLESAPAVSLVRAAGAPTAAGGVARMVARKGGRMVVRVHGLRPTSGDRWYEVWMLRDHRRMVSVGRFRVRADGTGTARFRLSVDPSRYPSMDVTLQSAADGQAHSGRSVLRSPSET
jgi:hypothetical protein